ncbi:hypothetical protein [Motilibacter deserti]|uniref:Ig-like domain-containing protein n=1 Tax=Motilibacter deserti TaxID=2714956 RepID=A0ABX0GYP0_9ACTN|nr:hypothetical protein [Motilibacter deserti]NHC16122.1 hypothetical protein [Motilibacter deserti]
MRVRRAAAVVTGGLLAALLLPPSAAGAQTPTRLESLTVSPTATTLQRAELAVVRVTAHLVDPDGVTARRELVAPDRSEACPCVTVEQPRRVEAQAQPWRSVPLRLTSGTAEDGIWQGSFALGAASAGTWTVTGIAAGDLRVEEPGPYGTNLVPVAPLVDTAPTFTVRGVDWPRLTLTLPRATVDAGDAYVLRGTARYARTGRPAAGVRLSVRHTLCDVLDGYGGVEAADVRTDANGRWSLRSRVVAGNWCVWLGEHEGSLEPVSLASRTRAFVRAVATAEALHARVDVKEVPVVRGRARPSLPVVLERWTGRAWQPDGETVPGPDGDYTVSGTPARPGTTTYRVRVLGDPYVARGTVTDAVTVRVG